MKQAMASHLAAVILGGMAILGFTATAHADEETTIEAFATWQGEGKLVPMGSKPAVLVATLTGVVYIQTEHGPVRGGILICPAIADVSLQDGTQTGRGRCVWTANDGDQVYADWTCKGRHLIGCKGDFTLTGGTGRFEGVTGGGPVVLRSELGTAAVEASGQAIDRTATGIMFWPAMTYKIPDRQ